MALTTFSDLVQEARERGKRDALAAGLPDDGKRLASGGTGAASYADAVGVYLAFAVSKAADRNWSALRRGTTRTDRCVARSVGKHFQWCGTTQRRTHSADSAGDMIRHRQRSLMMQVLDVWLVVLVGHADRLTLRASPQRWKVVSTDPPYYDNIGYADLSDFFYVWLRRSLKPVFPTSSPRLPCPRPRSWWPRLPPWQQGEGGDLLPNGMTQAMHRLAEQAHPAFPVTIYYAFKQSETDDRRGHREYWLGDFP